MGARKDSSQARDVLSIRLTRLIDLYPVEFVHTLLLEVFDRVVGQL